MRRLFYRKIAYCIAVFTATLCLSGCSSSGPAPSSGGNVAGTTQSGGSDISSTTLPDENSPSASAASTASKGSRDNTPSCLVPLADGISVLENEAATLDYSHCDEGYISVRYNGLIEKIKLRITGPDQVVYTYDLKTKDYEVFPLTGGNGSYSVAVYENVQDTEYVTSFYETIEVNITDELGAYLYPNQYVNFSSSSKVVSTAKELVYSANTDIDAVNLVYNYIIENITYDYDLASSSPTGYVPNVDSVLDSKKGICLDYASVMCSMLRSQGIPTRLEIGYAADAYHAWISVYISDIGWINGIIEFSGDTWTLMDPTFGASTDDTTLKKFIGDGTNYVLQKIY